MELIIRIAVLPTKVVHKAATVGGREKKILGLEPKTVETILRNHIPRELLAG